MIIYLTTGIGFGKNPLSAFDNALKEAGVYNYNIIHLSSIIPPQTTIEIQKPVAKKDEYGNRLYVVMAEKRSRENGKFIGAGLGWYQIKDNRGVFVEHSAIGETEDAVRSNLEEDVSKSLIDLCKFRNYKVVKKNLKMKLAITEIKDSAACTLVAAVYKSEPW